MKNLKWVNEIIRSKKSKKYLKSLKDKYNKPLLELDIDNLTRYERECLYKTLKLRGYDENTIKLLFK